MSIHFTPMQEKSYMNSATAFIFPLNRFIDNNENEISISDLPSDIKFQAIQGFNKLMACFYSETKEMSYWCKLPCKIGDEFSIHNLSSIIVDLRVDELTNYMFEENESIFKAGYDANIIGWQKALVQ